MKRASAIALTALLLAGCQDMGLPGNLPLEAAAHAAPSELVAAVHAHGDRGEAVALDGRLWVPWGLPRLLDGRELRPVGSVQGLTVQVRSWDRSPYDALFVRTVADEWQGYAPVIGHSRVVAGAH